MESPRKPLFQTTAGPPWNVEDDARDNETAAMTS